MRHVQAPLGSEVQKPVMQSGVVLTTFLLLDVLMFFSLLESVLRWVSVACFLLLAVSEDAAWESGCILIYTLDAWVITETVT